MTQPKRFRELSPIAINRSRLLRKNLTEAEKKLWQCLRLRQLEGYKFRRQHPVGKYIADFACIKHKLIIELDGGQHAEQQSYDQKRDNFLKSQGYTILRFWNNDVIENIDGIIETILEQLSTS